MYQDIPIRQITCDPDARIAKIDTPRGPQFALPIFYHLTDGRIVSAHYTARRQRDVQAYRDQLPLSPSNLSAEFRDGRLVGTVFTMAISR